jgi:hypothetical protein
MVDYQNGKIYEIVDKTNGKRYIGSTTQSLSKRLAKHREDYDRYLKKKQHYISSFEILKNNNYDIFLLEKYPCNSKEELHRKEGEYQRKLECVNMLIAGRTKK